MNKFIDRLLRYELQNYNKRSPSLCELTPIIFNVDLTHLRLETSNSDEDNCYNDYHEIIKVNYN